VVGDVTMETKVRRSLWLNNTTGTILSNNARKVRDLVIFRTSYIILHVHGDGVTLRL
jgi:hypothetical protein